MKKKIISICLALALLAVNQRALASWLTMAGEVAVPPEIAAMMAEEPVISVAVQPESWIVANPYGMEVERDGVVSRDEIVSPPVVLENQSAVPVRVDVQASVSAAEGSDVVFVQAPPRQDTTAKNVFLYAEFQTMAYADGEAAWSGSFFDGDNQILVTSTERAKEGVMRLEAAGMPYSAGAMHVFGSLTHSPERAWGEYDGFTVSVIFSFAAEGVPLMDFPVMGPVEETPVAETPDAVVPDEETPDEEIPDETVPDEETPDEEIPDEPVPDEVTPDESVPDEPVPDTDIPAEDGSEPDVSLTE